MIAQANSRDILHVLENFYFPSKRRIRAEHTRNCYRFTFRAFNQFLGRRGTLDDLYDDMAAAFLHWMGQTKSGNGRTRNERTLNDKLSDFHAFWRWCARRGLVDKWPSLDPLDEPRRIPRAYRVEELESLLRELRSQPGTVEGIPAGWWWESLYRTAYGIGERRTALLMADTEHLDFSAGTLFIPAEYRKGRKSDMLYHLLPDALELLYQMSQFERQKIWPWTKHETTFYYRSRRIHERAGIAKGGLQKMRRTFASYLKRHGGDATAALDHSSPHITRMSYLDPAIVNEEPENRRLPSLPGWNN